MEFDYYLLQALQEHADRYSAALTVITVEQLMRFMIRAKELQTIAEQKMSELGPG
jgi:hypothetical protein